MLAAISCQQVDACLLKKARARHEPHGRALLPEYGVVGLWDQEGLDWMNDLLTVAEVAEVANMFRVNDATVRKWIKQGALEAITLPHAITRQASCRIKRETLNQVLNSQTN